jgi:hypothetical protein
VMGVQLAAVEPARRWAGGAVTPSLEGERETRWVDVHSRGFRSLPVRILDFGIVLQSPIRWWRSISPARIASVLVCLSSVLRWVVIGSESFLIYCGVSLSTVSLRFISGHATLHFIILQSTIDRFLILLLPSVCVLNTVTFSLYQESKVGSLG